ncbi:MAG TPA: hypothetical protein VN213_18480, partial [Solirubrobacteraceae bacterium]|nr:hypothetical protein [Solirubrobacteraceae bacterium]
MPELELHEAPARGPRRRMRWLALAAAAVAALLAVPVALAATPAAPQPGQRLEVKVLLITATGEASEAGFGAWKTALEREGMPYDTFIADQRAPLTDADLADYGAAHGRYSAVILASGDVSRGVSNPDGTVSFLSAFSDAEWETLAKFERTFGVRRISEDTFPSPVHGFHGTDSADLAARPVPLTVAATEAPKDATLTEAGKAVFPYLKGTVPIDVGTSGYEATPLDAANFQTLLTGPAGRTVLGVYTHPEDGREEMVMTVPGNSAQIHNQLLRHGMLGWVTRGVYLGYQRNYLELHVDDLFLGDDAWDPVANVTSYDPAVASRMDAEDVAKAVDWSRSRGLRLDMAYNGGGSALYRELSGADRDPLLDAVNALPDKSVFGWINHTFEHPNLNCSTTPYITRQVTDNIAFARANALPLASDTELVTGEHSGLANSRPGNPGTIDPPFFTDDVAVGAGGSLAAGSYEWGVTARTAAGETPASISAPVAVPASGTARVSFNVVCGATEYRVYRRPATAGGTGEWSLAGTIASTADAPTDDGTQEASLTFSDTGATVSAAAPPTGNTAVIPPRGQNPALFPAVTAAGIRSVATDASKQYPDTSVASNPFGTDVGGSLLPAGATFFEGTAAAGFRGVPRHPSNVYYNVSTQGQQLDEYNWIYYRGPAVDGVDGNCVDVPAVTTCRTTPATWADYVASENRIMFGHLMGNDPRPHYVHQSNLADWNPALPATDPAQGGILYAVVDSLLDNWYEKYFDRASTPLVQLTQTEIGAELERQAKWARDVANGRVSAYLQEGELHIVAKEDMQVPVTGTSVGELYGGQRSGIATVKATTQAVVQPPSPESPAAEQPAPPAAAAQPAPAAP